MFIIGLNVKGDYTLFEVNDNFEIVLWGRDFCVDGVGGLR